MIIRFLKQKIKEEKGENVKKEWRKRKWRKRKKDDSLVIFLTTKKNILIKIIERDKLNFFEFIGIIKV